MKTVVIGAGLAGLATAIKLREAGVDVTLITKGIGGLQLGQGTFDIFGYHPGRVTYPIGEVSTVEDTHPYAKIGAEAVQQGADFISELLGEELVVGSTDKNFLLPTAVGAIRPTALAQPSMVAGHCEKGKKFIIAGPVQLKDFYPRLIAANLSRTDLPGGGRVEAEPASFSIPARVGEADSSGLNYARALDRPEYRETFIKALKPLVKEGYALGLPGFLGLKDRTVYRVLSDALGVDVFEIPLPPPGVPGMRHNEALTAVAKKARVKIMLGAEVLSGNVENGKLVSVNVGTAGHDTVVEADTFVLAAGGFESGSLTLDSYGLASERIFNLPLTHTDIPEPTHGEYWGDPQPIFRVGVAVDEDMRVLDESSAPVYDNLYAVGGIIGGAIRWSEKTGEGIALGSAIKAAQAITGGK